MTDQYITRLETVWRSVPPCDRKPKFFSCGGYDVSDHANATTFDFSDMEASTSFEGGHLIIGAVQTNIDEGVMAPFSLQELTELIGSVERGNFEEAHYHCDMDSEDDIELELLQMAFYGSGGRIKSFSWPEGAGLRK